MGQACPAVGGPVKVSTAAGFARPFARGVAH